MDHIEEAEQITADINERLELLKKKTKYLFSIPDFKSAKNVALDSLEISGYPDGDYSVHGSTVAHFLGDVAKAYLYMDQLDKAMEFAKKSEEEAKKSGDLAERSRALNILAYTIRWRDNDVQKAIEIWNKAAKLAKEAGNPEVEGNMYHGIANAYWQLRDEEKSREFYRKALAIFENSGLMEGIAMEVKGLGDTYLTEENYDRAMDYFIRAKELYNMLNDRKNEAVVRMHIGLCHMNLGDFRLAQEEFLEAKSLASFYKKGSDSVRTSSIINLAELYDRMGMYDMEEKMALEAMEEIEKGMQVRERDVDIGTVKLSLARVEMARKNPDKAKALLAEAIEGLKKDRYYLDLLAEAHARMYAITGEDEEMVTALKYLRESGSQMTLERLKKSGLLPEDATMED